MQSIKGFKKVLVPIYLYHFDEAFSHIIAQISTGFLQSEL